MPVSNQREEIDERILRLLGLEDVFDLDYETYMTLLKEAMVKGRMVNQTIPTEELMLLDEEYKKVKSKKEQGRFEVKKRKISVGSFSIGNIKGAITAAGPARGLLPAAETIAKSPIQKGLEDNITAITNAVVSISETLKQQKKLSEDTAAYDKRKAEQDKRGLAESKLEKRFEGLKKAAEKIIAPVKSLLDRILEFFTTVILGRIVYKLIEWLGNPENTNKVKSIIRFLGDWGPALLGGFILFGTKFGKGVRILTSIALSGIAKLAKAIPALLRFAKSNPRTAAAVTVGAYAATQLAQRAFSGEEQKVEQRAGGGVITVPKFAGGGFNLSSMFGGLDLSSMFGGFRNYFSGSVSGEKGVDKIPAWLSDGEFVVSAGAVRKYGVETFEAMNAAGGGTNRPTFKNESVYAQGGGFIGNPIAAQEAWVNYMKLNPEKFMKGSVYGDMDSANKASRDFMKTFMSTGQPPSWAQFVEEVEKVKSNKQQNYQKSPKSSGFSWKDWWKNQTSSSTKSSTTPPKPPTSSAISTSVRTPTSRGRGYGGALQAAFAAMEFNDRKQAGQTTAQAGLGAAGSALGGQVGWMGGAKAGAIIGGGIGAMFAGVGAGPGAAIGAIIGGVAGGFGGASLGGKLADDLSGLNSIKERMNRGGIGGSVKGGYGLASQSFKDAPKTMVMTDDKGRPFVGHKALKNGKLTYVRPQKPGTGTTNPLEALGRMINPNAYRENDQRLAMKNQRISMVNALESFQKQGMSPDAQARMMKQMGGNLKDVQNDLNYRKIRIQKEKEEQKRLILGNDKSAVLRRNNVARIAAQQTKKPAVKPPMKPKPKVVVAGGGMNGGRGSGSRPSTSTKTPNFSASNKSRSKINILGITI